MAEHKALSFMEIVSGNVAALEIRADKEGVTLINVHRRQAGSPPWPRRAAFWHDIQMDAAAGGLGRHHPVVIACDTNIYISALGGRPMSSGGPQQAGWRT